MEREGRYLLARHELTVLVGRLPTVQEIADHMEVSVRTVETTRAGMRTWQQEASDDLGWAPPDGLHPLDGLVGVRAKILGAYSLGELSTSAAAAKLAEAGLPADRRELTRWRTRQRMGIQPTE